MTTETPKAPGRQVNLPTKTTAKVLAARERGELTLSFPKADGFLSVGRNEFADFDELVSYIADSFGLEARGNGLRGKTVRRGKYRKLDGNGSPAFTFGDPVLDLITDENAIVIVGGRRLPLGVDDLREPKSRHGGLRDVDLAAHSDRLRDAMLRDAALGRGSFALLACDAESAAFASTNPSQRDFFRDGGHMRFKAWKKSSFFYWSMGAEIETWGGDFDTAQINSTYLDTFLGNPGLCKVVDTDSDSDSDDDYVDEYEWGVNAPQPLRVISFCEASWKGAIFSGVVEAGPDCFVV
jgi:hypothetical protein